VKCLRSVVLAALCFSLPSKSASATVTVRENAEHWARYYADAYSVRRELVYAVIQVESNWNPLALSPRGARGLMQLMPRTAARFGVRDAFVIAENVRGGVAYLALLIRLFKGDLRLVAAAYVAGEGPILSRGLDYSSREVFVYVSRVLSVYAYLVAQARGRCEILQVR
jgi:soluble lytic murein transglycosylase-like protein